MSNSKRRVPAARWMACVALAGIVPMTVNALTVDDIAATNLRVKDLEAKTSEAKARNELEKAGGSAGATGGVPAKTLTPERTLDDGIALLSVVGPSADPTYVVQYRGVPMPLKMGREAMDGWTLDSVKGNRLVLVKRNGKHVAETRTVTMSDVSYASQREQQRVDAARMQAGAAGPGGMVSPFGMGPQLNNVDKAPTP